MRSCPNSRFIIYIPVLCLLSLLAAGCAPSVSVGTDSGSPPALSYGQPVELARLRDARIDESSGIAASIRYGGAFWTHNDSGDSARIFLINKEGGTLAVVVVRGVSAFDWEDIASYRLGDAGYVLIADVGDNDRRRESCVLYILREPEIPAGSGGEEAPVIEVEPDCRIDFRYEDGPRDCEAVGVDPAGSMIYLASKETEACAVYCMPIPSGAPGEEPYTARKVAPLEVPYATAMDISPDGRRAVVLTYGDAYAFSRGGSETWAQAFSREGRLIRAPVRRQGESVCYGPDGRTLYLTSENAQQPLWEIPVVEGSK
ncbi:MAG: hypothetical protein JW793_00085 [Acidobacteria bacterium]|nr:hypothetical protein [Acidobacteriota bacterium]